MTGICKYSKCSAPPTCYRHYDAVNDCVYYDHTPNTEEITVKPYAPTSFVCTDGTIQTGINAVVACAGHDLPSSKPQGWQCPDGTTQYGTSDIVACQGHMTTRFRCPDGTTQYGNDVNTACKGHDTITVLKPQDVIPKSVQSVQSNSNTSQTSTTSQVIPTSNNQYPSASIPKTPTSQASSTSQSSIQNVSMLSRIYDFVSLYRDYFIGFIIVAMVIVVLIGKGKKHE